MNTKFNRKDGKIVKIEEFELTDQEAKKRLEHLYKYNEKMKASIKMMQEEILKNTLEIQEIKKYIID